MQKGVVRKRRPAPISEYGRQLKEKQDLRKQYHLGEKQFRSYVLKALSKGVENSPELLLQNLEKRLDNVVFRAGLASTRAEARQMVSHKHFLWNGKPSTTPSLAVKKGDVISLHPSSKELTLFKNVKLGLKKYEPPSWLELDKEKMEIKVVGSPALEEIAPTVEIPLIFEFYSK